MADQLYLSLWVQGFRDLTMLSSLEKLLRRFPFSHLRPGVSFLRVYAVEFAEPALAEHSFGEQPTVETLLEVVREYQNADCCFEIEGWWDIWEYQTSWKLEPAPVRLLCFGPEFDNEIGDNLRIEFGIDTHFLPQPELPDAARKAQSNLKGLLRLVHDLDDGLRLEKRRLWLESGENFAERFQDLVE